MTEYTLLAKSFVHTGLKLDIAAQTRDMAIAGNLWTRLVRMCEPVNRVGATSTDL